MSDVRWRKTALVVVLLLAVLCLADGDDGFDENPILIKQPAFACSLPVQILLNGIVLALTAVLLFHLLFTAQYHYPLAPLNYLLQLAGVLSLLISLIATLYVVLTSSLKDSREWPYMLTYLAKDVPPSSTNATDLVYAPTPWTTAELAAWYAMAATTSGLVQITHIQFLTLLYPSKLERNLILCLLGPLALLSAAMELLPIHQSQTIVDIASTIRNTCNAALSLLFTSALFLYGLLVNRTQAWRTDGGTAVFGSAALALALISTALNFLYIPTKDRYLWLPSLIWAVVLWQSFLGWWWWVGGGRGVSEVEELLEREERRERKRKARERRRVERKEKAQALWKNASENLTMHFGRKGSVVYRHSTAGHHNVMNDGSNNSNSNNNNSKEINRTGEGVETSTTTLHDEGANRANSGNHNPRQRIPGPTPSETGSASFSNTSSPSHTSTSTGTSTSTQSGIFSRLLSSPPLLALSHFYHLLRRAHLAAAHSQALERMRKRREVYRRELGGTDVTAAVSVGADISATAASSIDATGADIGEKASDFSGAGVSAGTGGVDKKGNASKAKNKNNNRYRRRHVPHSLGSDVGVGVGIDTSTGDGIGARRVVDEPNVVGWGLGSFGLRRERRDAENLFARSRALRGMGARTGTGTGTGVEMERTETFMSASSDSSSVGSIRSVDSAATVIATGADLGLDADPELGRTSTSVRGLRGRGIGRSGRGNVYSSSGYGRGSTGNARGKRWRRRERGLTRGVGEDEEENGLEGDEEELESVDGERNGDDYRYGEENEVDLEEPIQDRTRPRSHPRTHPVVRDNVLRGGEHTRAEGGGWSPWWWGPMRRWRLQDSTVYS